MARDDIVRGYVVPEGFKAKVKQVPNDKNILGPMPKQQFVVQEHTKKTEADLYNEQTDDYVLDIRKHWDLPKADQKYDDIPEIWNGKNIADYIDPEIEEKIAALLAEEEEREANGFYDIDHEQDNEQEKELRALGQHIRGVKLRHMAVAHRERRIQQAQVNRMAKSAGTAKDLKNKMEGLGLDLQHWDEAKQGMDDDADTNKINVIERGRARASRKRRAEELNEKVFGEEEDMKVQRSESRPAPRDKSGMRDAKQVKLAGKKRDKSRTTRNHKLFYGTRGEGDRHIPDNKPKHLFSGKRGIGSTDRR